MAQPAGSRRSPCSNGSGWLSLPAAGGHPVGWLSLLAAGGYCSNGSGWLSLPADGGHPVATDPDGRQPEATTDPDGSACQQPEVNL